MEVTGTIRDIQQTKEVGSKGFKKRDLILTTSEQYPQHLCIQFVQDKVNLLDNFSIGETVVIGINIHGREWINPQGESVYFNTLNGWRITKENVNITSDSYPKPEPIVNTELNEDGLPF